MEEARVGTEEERVVRSQGSGVKGQESETIRILALVKTA
jgi:hypothetical protein